MRMLVLITLIAFVSSCNTNAKSADQEWRSAVKDSVLQMTASIAKDVSDKGPRAWLQYFKDTSDFFMASGGQLVFANNDSAKNFINHVLVKVFVKLNCTGAMCGLNRLPIH